MKIAFLAENVQKKLSFAMHAVSSRSQLPILTNLLLEAKKGELIISATDLEIGIIIKTNSNVEEEGSVTVPAKTFFDLLSTIGKGKVSLVSKDKNMELKTERIKTVFQTSPTEDYPKIIEKKGALLSVVEPDIIKKDLSSVVFAASQDTGRPALSGVLMEKEGSGLVVVATDGFRLSLKRNLKINIDNKIEKPFLIPSRVIKELISMSGEGEDIKIYTSEESSQVIFEQKDITLVGRLIEADYPAYEKILPVDYSTTAVFDREEFLDAIKVCSVFARETANIIKISIEKEKMVLSANTPSVGENSVDVSVHLSGEENEIAFNARYLLDLFSCIETNDVVFEMTGPLNPGVFKIKDDKTFLHLIMPIRVQE